MHHNNESVDEHKFYLFIIIFARCFYNLRKRTVACKKYMEQGTRSSHSVHQSSNFFLCRFATFFYTILLRTKQWKKINFRFR